MRDNEILTFVNVYQNLSSKICVDINNSFCFCFPCWYIWDMYAKTEEGCWCEQFIIHVKEY